MKNIIPILFLGLILSGSVTGQTLSPKKALKKSSVLVEEGNAREAVSILSRHVNTLGKYQANIAFELGKQQAQILLLDSAILSFDIAAKADDAELKMEIEKYKLQVLDSLSKYNLEVALGKKHLQDRDFSAAKISFTNAMRYDTGNYQAWFGLAEIAHLSSSLSSAITLYYTASEKYTASTEEKAHVYEHIAEAYITQRNFKQAVEICDSALLIAPETIEAHYWKARALFLQRYFGNAAESVTQYLNLEAEDKLAWVLRGDCSFYQKLYAAAIVDYNEALILDENMVEVYSNRGMSFYYLEKYDSANADFLKLLSFNEGNFYADNALGVIAYTQNDYKKAVDYFEQATSITGIEEYTYNLTIGYFKNNQLDLALHHITNLTSSNEHQLKYNILKMNVLMQLKKYDEARKWINRLTKSNPYIKNYHLLSAELYHLQGDEKNAEKSNKIAHHMKDINVSLAPSF